MFLVIATSALGAWGASRIAPEIERKIATDAAAAATGWTHPLTVTVSGRDIAVSGLADSATEREAILTALRDVPGERGVHNGLTILFAASPYTFSMEKDGDAEAHRGYIPTEAARAAIAPVMGPGASVLELASGAPDGWVEALEAGLGALAPLRSGAMEISDTTLTLRGLAPNPTGAAASEAALELLPPTFTTDVALDLEDDGLPFALALSFVRGGRTVAAGKLPATMSPEALAPLRANPEIAGLRIARIPSKDGLWPTGAEAFIAAVAALQEAELTLEDRVGSIEGVGTRAEIAAAEAALAALPAGFEAETEFTIFDDGSPMTLNAVKDASGTVLSGKLPFGARPSDLGLPTFSEGITIAEIEGSTPDFLARARLALDTLRMLADATLRMEATAIELTGHGTRSQIARALDLLDRLPDDMAAAIDLTPLDDGLPLGLTAEKSGGTVTLVGKMPFGTQATALGLESFGEAMIVSEIDAKAANFLTTAQVGLSALTAFEDGKLVVQDAEEVDGPALLTLTGTVTRAGLQAVNAALGALPARVAPAIDVAFADDGTPLRLAAFWDGTRLEATGKLPFDADLEDLGLEAPGPALQIAEIDAQSAAFLDIAEDGLDALRALEEGSFNLADASDLGGAPSVTLAGVARTPVEERLARDALEDYDATLTITLLDDGAPPLFALGFNATTGAVLTGKLPDGLSTSKFADALGIASVETDVIEGLVGDADGLAEDIAALATWLPEIENLTLEYDGRRWINFAITPLPGVDVGLLRNGLRADLGIRPAVTEGPPLSMGTERVNAATGQLERLTPSGWLRVFDFTPSLARCDEASAAILETTKITFLSSSSRLDARSLRAINALSGAILHCLQALPMLTVEVGGHTDARGGAQGNLALSQNRANAVAAALIDRGIPAEALTAVGFGETQPIADNGTAEGRAQNRRTTLSWSANQ